MIFVYRTSVVGPSGIPLSDYEEGAIIKLNEGGSPVEFYVAKHDYEIGLNGAGRTLVVRKDCYGNRAWDAGNVNAYASSNLDAWFNGTYKNLLDPAIQTSIGTTKFYHTLSFENWTIRTLERAVFALSATELGQSASWFNVEGSALPIASTLQVAHLNGRTNTQWTRSPFKNSSSNAIFLNDFGDAYNYTCDHSEGSRPAFTLPSTLLFNPDTNEVVA